MWALDGPPTPEVRRPRAGARAVILEPHPAVSAVLEYLLAREGFRVEAHVEARAEALHAMTVPGVPRALRAI